jgi:hypothetical protein
MNGNTGRRGPRERPWRWRAGTLITVATAIVLLASACSGTGAPASPAASSRPAGYQRFLAYSKCMRAHGAPFWPDPSRAPGGVYDYKITYKITSRILRQEQGPGWHAALTACRTLAPPELPVTAAQIRTLRSQLRNWPGACARTGSPASPAPMSARLPASHQPGQPARAQLAAWTVAKQADGEIDITIRELRDPAGLQTTLRADGLPATVSFSVSGPPLNPACQPHPANKSLLGSVFPFHSRKGSVRLVIDPSALPSGAGVSIFDLPHPPPPPPHARLHGVPVIGVGLVWASQQCTGS